MKKTGQVLLENTSTEQQRGSVPRTETQNTSCSFIKSTTDTQANTSALGKQSNAKGQRENVPYFQAFP